MADHTRIVSVRVINGNNEFTIKAVSDPVISELIDLDGTSNQSELIVSTGAVTNVVGNAQRKEIEQHYLIAPGDLVQVTRRWSRGSRWTEGNTEHKQQLTEH